VRREAVGWRRAAGLVALLPAVPLAVLKAQRSRAIRLVVRAALLGLPAAELTRRTRAFGADLAREPGRVIRAGVAAVRAHAASGDRVVVVTASEQNLARAFLDALGLSTVELVATRVYGRSGVVHNRGAEKVRQLAARGITPPWHVAYSDSLTDLPMLAGARHAVLVNAAPRVLARACAALPGRVSAVRWR
jgi:phosphatidylglycerophosphatase C